MGRAGGKLIEGRERGKNFLGGEQTMKEPEAREYLGCSKKSRKDRMAGAE